MNSLEIRPYAGSCDYNSVQTEWFLVQPQNAVSDLEKDQVLRQYQYFVGDRRHADMKAAGKAQRPLRVGENFSL